MKKKQRLRLISYFVIVYLLVAFTWWAVLLYVKTQESYAAKIKLYQVELGLSKTEFLNTSTYSDLKRKLILQQWMIIGEGAVFIVSLVIGVWLVNRGYYKEMEAARQSRNFLLSITHELKSPIASIRLTLETFLKRDLKKQQFGWLAQNALVESDRLNELVSNLLLAAKLEAPFKIHLEEIDLIEHLTNIILKLKSKYPDTEFTFSKNIDSVIINADRFGITTIVLNLLENAVKYTKRSPIVQIEVDKNDEKQLILKISDNGGGINDDEKRKVFTKFYRIGNEDTRATKGTGLGLYITKQLVKAHGGKIRISDNEPVGSTFSVFLPLTD